MSNHVADQTPLQGDEALLVVVHDPEGVLESGTVFVPYRKDPPPGASAEWYASLYVTAWGQADISYSYLGTYKLIERKSSGLYTGVPLAGEYFERFDHRQEAVDAFKPLYLADRKRRGFRN